MYKNFIVLLLFSIGLILPEFLCAQTNDLGGIGSISVSKNFGKSWDAKLEQELRVNQNLRTFDRSLTSLEVGYTIIKKLLKAEIDYDFIYQHQNEYFEIRHRSSASLATQISFFSFDLGLQSKGQVTWRDENRGDYKYNPKYVWRNKLECGYSIFGSPVKPFISGEFFCPLNGANGFYLNSYRLILGAKYRLSKATSLQFFLRYDQDIQQANPKNILYGGIGWNYKL